jgi:hypothetical protein
MASIERPTIWAWWESPCGRKRGQWEVSHLRTRPSPLGQSTVGLYWFETRETPRPFRPPMECRERKCGRRRPVRIGRSQGELCRPYLG